MRAHVGDQLLVGPDRIGVVIGVPAEDGSPPYIIKWLKDGHIAMVQPDQYARIIPATRRANSTVVSGEEGEADVRADFGCYRPLEDH
jgi:hypothetical protein